MYVLVFFRTIHFPLIRSITSRLDSILNCRFKFHLNCARFIVERCVVKKTRYIVNLLELLNFYLQSLTLQSHAHTCSAVCLCIDAPPILLLAWSCRRYRFNFRNTACFKPLFVLFWFVCAPRSTNYSLSEDVSITCWQQKRVRVAKSKCYKLSTLMRQIATKMITACHGILQHVVY